MVKEFIPDFLPPEECINLDSAHYSSMENGVAFGRAGLGKKITSEEISTFSENDGERKTIETLGFDAGYRLDKEEQVLSLEFQERYVVSWFADLIENTCRQRPDFDEENKYIDVLTFASSTLLDETKQLVHDELVSRGFTIGTIIDPDDDSSQKGYQEYALYCNSATAALVDTLHRYHDDPNLFHVIASIDLTSGNVVDQENIGTYATFDDGAGVMAFRGKEIELLTKESKIVIDQDEKGVIQGPLIREFEGNYEEGMLPEWYRVKKHNEKLDVLPNGIALALIKNSHLIMDGPRTLHLFAGEDIIDDIEQIVAYYHENLSDEYRLGHVIGHQPSKGVFIGGLVRQLLIDSYYSNELERLDVASEEYEKQQKKSFRKAKKDVKAILTKTEGESEKEYENRINAVLDERGLPRFYWTMDEAQQSNSSSSTPVIAMGSLNERGLLSIKDEEDKSIAYPLIGLGAGASRAIALITFVDYEDE